MGAADHGSSRHDLMNAPEKREVTGSTPVPTTTVATHRRFFWGLAAIAGSALVAHAAYVHFVGRHVEPGLDSTWYVIVGHGLANGDGYSDPAALLDGVAVPTANFPPLFPMALALLHRLGVESFAALQHLGGLSGAATGTLTALLARRVTGRPAIAVLAGLLVALSPPVIAANASVMAEAIAVPLVVGTLLAAHVAVTSSSLRLWALTGALAGLATLARSEALLLAFVLVPVFAVLRIEASRRAVAVAVAVAMAMCVIAPWVGRNLVRFDEPILVSTNADKTIAGANCDSVYSGDAIGLWDHDCLREGRLTRLGEARFATALRNEGLDYMRSHAGELPKVAAVRVLRAWGVYDPGQQVNWEAIETRDRDWQRLAWAWSIALFVLAIPGVFALRSVLPSLFVVAGPAVVATVTVAATYGNQRFLLPAIPGLCIAAATSVGWWQRAKETPRGST